MSPTRLCLAMSQDSWSNSWPQQSNWTQEGKGKRQVQRLGKGQYSKNSYGCSGPRDGTYNNYYSGYNASRKRLQHQLVAAALWYTYRDAQVGRHYGGKRDGDGDHGLMKDIAVDVASKWAKLVSNVVMKTAAGAIKSATLSDSDTAATTTTDSSQKSSKQCCSQRDGARTHDRNGQGRARWQRCGEHLLQEPKKTSHNTGKRSKRWSTSLKNFLRVRSPAGTKNESPDEAQLAQ